MNDLGSKLYASDQILTTLGFPKGEMSRISADSIERMWTIPHVIYDPDNRSITTASTTAAGLSYFPAWVDPDVTDNRLGVYRPAFGVIYIDRLASDEVAIHELMHAVQYGQINNAWDHGWVREGLASAVQVFAPSNTAPSGGEFRYYGNWRDWQFPLSSNDNINEYKVSEFWLTLDGTLSLLPTFYSNLGASLLTEYNAYLEVDDALINTGLPSIRDGYTSLIQSRNSDPGYEYCALPLGLICSDTSCDILTDTAPFSAQCFDIYNIENDLCPEEETPDIKVTLVSDSEQFPFANMKLMVDGIIHDANTEVPFSEGHIWSINTTYTDGNSPTEVTLKFECQTDYMKLVKQRINSDATAVATTSFFNTLSPSRETSFQTYNSFEDLSADSFITTYKWSDGVIIDEDVIVEPLNLDVWGASNSVSAFAQLQEDGDASTASASSSVSTDTESDATSMTTTGQQSATASISGAPIYARASNSNEYTYAIGPVPVELTLSWACSMSNVQVYIINPVGGGSETLLLTSNNVNPLFNNWECGTRVWTIPPDNNVEIRIFTTFDEYPEAGESNEIYQNSGGLFEIILQAILPEN